MLANKINYMRGCGILQFTYKLRCGPNYQIVRRKDAKKWLRDGGKVRKALEYALMD